MNKQLDQILNHIAELEKLFFPKKAPKASDLAERDYRSAMIRKGWQKEQSKRKYTIWYTCIKLTLFVLSEKGRLKMNYNDNNQHLRLVRRSPKFEETSQQTKTFVKDMISLKDYIAPIKIYTKEEIDLYEIIKRTSS